MQTSIQQSNKNLIYLYDLPKNEFTSARLAELLKEANIELEHKPQVRRDPTKPFYSGIMCIKNEEIFKKATDFLRYFQIAGIDKEGNKVMKSCRGLPFDNSLLGTNLTKTNESCNIFVRKIPKDMTAAQLDKIFSEFDPDQLRPVKSLKISMNEDHSSRGYGFVCYDNSQDAARACELMDERSDHRECIAIKWNPKDRSDVRRVFNNLYVKNYPDNFTEDDLSKLFSQYGRVSSLCAFNHPHGKFAFVCYMSEDKNDHEYGPTRAHEAIEKLNGKDMGDGKHLYVKPALSASKRKEELLRETIKYKNSKKRCNLYVKNFDPTCTDKELCEMFKDYGEIESVKLFPVDKPEKAYAFVCFKTPDQAQQALQYMQTRLMNGRQLQICHYELKEFREIQDEETKDKLGFQRFKQLNYQSSHWQDISSRDEFYYKITQLLQALPQGKFSGQFQRQNYQGQKNNLKRANTPHLQRPAHMSHNGNMMSVQNAGGRNTSADNQFNMNLYGQQMNQPQVPLPSALNSMSQQMQEMTLASGQDPTVQAFYNNTLKIVPSVKADNPHLKQSVGNAIFDFVTKLKGSSLAPKITGMLIDLPLEETQHFLSNYAEFTKKVDEAARLLIQIQQQAPPPQALQMNQTLMPVVTMPNYQQTSDVTPGQF